MSCSYFPLYMSRSQEKKARLIRCGVVAGGQAGGHRAGSNFESSASDAHTDPPWPPLTACDDGPLATPRPSGQPILERPPPPSPPRALSTRSTRWNHGTVQRSALRSYLYTSKSANPQSRVLLVCPHSPLLFTSGKHGGYSPPASHAGLKTHHGQTTDSESNGSCCLPACIFTIPSSPLLLHKLDRGTCIPGCAFLVSPHAPVPASADLFTASDAFTRPHTVKQHLLSHRIIVPSDSVGE
jgi:hypothetical protein